LNRNLTDKTASALRRACEIAFEKWGYLSSLRNPECCTPSSARETVQATGRSSSYHQGQSGTSRLCLPASSFHFSRLSLEQVAS
jgi:hypothetical protein